MARYQGDFVVSGDVCDAWQKAVKEGMAAAWPICLGYVAIGLAFGVIAHQIGLSPLEIGLMSLLVYAGSAQFIAVSMLGAGAGFLPVVMTTFSVNLRHLLMSSALSLHLKQITARWIAIFAYGVTDESFAVNIARFRQGAWGWRQALAVNHITNLIWIMSTVAGGIGGQFIPAGAFGLDYALIAMFVCLLVSQLRGRIHILVAVISGFLAVAIAIVLPGNYYILAASLVSASAGLALRRVKWLRPDRQGKP